MRGAINADDFHDRESPVSQSRAEDLRAGQFYRNSNLSGLAFFTTNDLATVDEFAGQGRALKALHYSIAPSLTNCSPVVRRRCAMRCMNSSRT